MDARILEDTTLATAVAGLACAHKGEDWVKSLIGLGRGYNAVVAHARQVRPAYNMFTEALVYHDSRADLTVDDRASGFAGRYVSRVELASGIVVPDRGSVEETETSAQKRFGHFKMGWAPNYQVYRACEALLHADRVLDPDISSSMQRALKFARIRVAVELGGVNLPAPISTTEVDNAIWFESLAEGLESAFKSSLKLQSNITRIVGRETFDSEPWFEFKSAFKEYEEGQPAWAKVEHTGQLVTLRIKGAEFPMTPVHYTRLVTMLRMFAQVALHWRDLSALVSSADAVRSLMTVAAGLDPKLVDHFPSGMRGYKQSVVASMDHSGIMGPRPDLALERTYSAEKRSIVGLLRMSFRSMFVTKASLANFMNLYRGMPHPDYSPELLFDTIKGLNHPNIVSPGRLMQFEGRVRRTMFTNLYAQKIRTNVEPADPEGATAAVVNAVRALNENNATAAVANSISDTVWSQLVLKSSYKNPKSYKLAPENKASAVDMPFDSYIDEAEPGSVHQNDIVSAAKFGEKKYLSVRRGYADYKRLVNRTIAKGGIGSKVDPEHLPVTSCSPKFGEVHKFTTRLFYLATRKMKSVLQTYERTVKQLIARQKGVSITKSARERRRGIETMARSLGGDDTRETVYISFDMSEFSKKFPVELTRIFTKVASEVTGEPDVSLISEVFRHTYAGFTSDTFTGKIWGIEGGFEGFLNFTWTSIHEVVMQIALDNVGLKGVLETFSDDGILMVYVPKDELPHFKGKAATIQKIYSEYGLEFHFSKTLVSTNVWEFLGDISVDGSLMTQFLKESGKAGVARYGKTFATASSTAEALLAQTTSGMIHGASADITAVLSHFTMLNYLRGFSPRMTDAEAFYMIIAPPGLGGFRVPPHTESYTRGMKIPLSEFEADLRIGFKHFGSDFLRVYTNVRGAVGKSNDAANSLVSNFPISAPSLSVISGGVTDSLISKAIAECPRIRLSGNPLRGKLGKALSRLARGATDVFPGVLSDLVMSSPAMSKYTESIVFTESQALLSLIGKEEIRKAQAKDTRSVRMSFKIISGAKHAPAPVRFPLVDKLLAVSHPNVDFAVVPPSYRAVFRPTFKRPKVPNPTYVTFEAPTGCFFDRVPFLEQVETFLPGTSSSIWATEGAPNDPRRQRLRYIQKAAAFLASNPGLESAVNVIAHYSGLPPVVDESVGHMSELRYISGATSSYLTISPLKSATALHMGDFIDPVYTVAGRADRSSHVAALKLMATYVYLSGLSRAPKHVSGARVYFSGSSDELCRRACLPTTRFPGSNLDTSACKDEFEEAYAEEVSDALAMESLATNLFVTKSSWDPALSAALGSELAQFVSSLMGGLRPSTASPMIPHAYYPAVESAIMELTYMRLPASLRGTFSLVRAGGARNKPEGLLSAGILSKVVVKPRFKDADDFFKARQGDTSVEISNGYFDLTSIGPSAKAQIIEIWRECLSAMRTLLPGICPNDDYVTEDEMLVQLAEYSAAGSIFSSSQITVASASLNRDGTYASSVLAAYKRAMTESLADVKMASRGLLIGRRGDFADALVTVRGCMFPSSHRKEPWNRRVAEAVYDGLQEVRRVLTHKRWEYNSEEDAVIDAMALLSESVGRAGMLNDEVVVRVLEGVVQSQPVMSHTATVASHIYRAGSDGLLEQSVSHRSKFNHIATSLLAGLAQTIRVIKPSVMTVLSGAMTMTETLRKVSLGSPKEAGPLSLDGYDAREPSQAELESAPLMELVRHTKNPVYVVDLATLDSAVTLVAEAVARDGVEVTFWSTRPITGVVYHVCVTSTRPMAVVLSEAGAETGPAVQPSTRRWVEVVLTSNSSGVSSIDPRLITRVLYGSRLEAKPEVPIAKGPRSTEIIRLAALASSCRSIDSRLKVSIYMTFLHIAFGMDTGGGEMMFKAVKFLAAGRNIKFRCGTVVNHLDFLRDAQAVFLYLASMPIPPDIVPYDLPDFIEWPPIVQSGAFAIGGYVGEELDAVVDPKPGGVASKIWVPRRSRLLVGAGPVDDDLGEL